MFVCEFFYILCRCGFVRANDYILTMLFFARTQPKMKIVTMVSTLYRLYSISITVLVTNIDILCILIKTLKKRIHALIVIQLLIVFSNASELFFFINQNQLNRSMAVISFIYDICLPFLKHQWFAITRSDSFVCACLFQRETLRVPNNGFHFVNFS